MDRGSGGAPGGGAGPRRSAERSAEGWQGPERRVGDAARRRRVRRDLEARGVPATLAGPLSECLGRAAPELSGEAYDAVLSSVTLAYGAQEEAPEPDAAPGAREVERLVERLAEELGKIDEGLRTLGAIAERLRSRAPAPPDATLH